jgi:hypothetical protein
MELVPKAEFSIVTRASKAWIPGADRCCRPEVTETYIDFFTSTIRNRNTRAASGLAGAMLQRISPPRCRMHLSAWEQPT